jgi:VanZ family protein
MRRRRLLILCLIAVAGILYGSLMPFDLNADEEYVRAKIRHFLNQWPLGDRRVSRGDIIANVALYVPLGVLIALACRPRRTISRLATVPAAAAVGLAVSSLVEYTQLFLNGRVSSPSDLVMNTIGAAAGAVLGVTVAPPLARGLSRRARTTWQEDPVVLMGALLACLLTADALFPLLPSLDVGQFIHSLRRSAPNPRVGWQLHAWHRWLVRRFLPWAAVAALLTGSRRDRSASRPLRVAVWVILLAAACEAGKLFIISRAANSANVLVSILAAITGSLVGYHVLQRRSPATVLGLVAVGLIGYVAYLEWRPFTFTWSMDLVRRKWPRGTQWLPLYHYAMGARPEDVRLFLRTVTLWSGAIFTALGWWPRLATTRGGKLLLGGVVGLLAGIVLEASQLALPPRVPSTTDVFCMALGGMLGGYLAHRWPLRSSPQAEQPESSGNAPVGP